jgi:pimeloyl-ACP methyl ester carboxylesterase
LGAFFSYLLACNILANQVISRSSSVIPTRPKELVVWNPSLSLPAWASPAVAKGEGKNVFVFSHGLKANRAFFEETALEMVRRGYDVVLLAMPGHEANPDPRLGFGPKEAQAIKETLNALKAKHVILVGTSLGGAASWLASDDPKVDGIVTESAFSHLDPVTRVWFDRKMPLGSLIFRPVIWIASWKLGINPADINPIETAKKWDHHKPALVIHAIGDALIPIEQGEELAKATGADFWKVPFVGHAMCQEAGTEYWNRVESVMKKVIADDSSKTLTPSL